jgi:predicted ATPase
LGGQILISAAAQQALHHQAVRLQLHGHWQLKGLAEPVELFEVELDGQATSPPPDADKGYRVVRQGDFWLPVREIRHTLPAERDAFVGRAPELAALSRHIQEGARLVSVLGMGGSGKTRMVTRFGWTRIGDFPGGVWFCDLVAARSEAGIAHAVATSLDIPLGKGDAVAQLANALAARGRCLVILDNFEQVARHAEATLGRWLDRAVAACFVVTTREILGLRGEHALALPPLAQQEAVALFMHRAQAAKSAWQPDAEDAATVAQLVKLLDGLPLAIELAAARVRAMAPRMLLERMGERFKLLSSSGGRQDRQATLRATLDWSWDLLTGADKAALAQLSVFEGGFNLESAEAVLDLSEFDGAAWPIDAVQSLVDKSFVRSLNNGRFELLVSVQDYAAEHLRTEGRFPGSGTHAGSTSEKRHRDHFASYAQRQDGAAAPELENLVIACRRAVSANDGVAAARTLQGAWSVLALAGPFEVGVSLAGQVCALQALDSAASAQALRVHADTLVASGQPGPAQPIYEDALRQARWAGDASCEVELLSHLGTLHLNQGRNEEARQSYQEALDLARKLGYGRLEASAINSLGNLERNAGRLAAALAHYELALQLARAAGDLRLQGSVLGNLVSTHGELGDIGQALARGEESLAIARATSNRLTEASTLCNLSMLLLVQGSPERARATSLQSLVIAREMGHVRLECIVQCNLGIALERLARADEAHTRFEAALQMAVALGDRRMQGQILGYQGLLFARRGLTGQALQCLAEGESLLRAVADPFSLGVLLCARAETEVLSGSAELAHARLAEARQMALEIGANPMSELGLALARVESLASTVEPVPRCEDPSLNMPAPLRPKQG